MKKKLLCLLLIFACLSLISALIVKVSEKSDKTLTSKNKIVTSFYPMYILAENLLDGIEEIELVNMTENQTGCLHDYQLTTKDMRIAESADVLIISGNGMESFVDDLEAACPKLTIIDSSKGIELLEGSEHHHHEDEAASGEDHDEDHHHELEEEGNPHVWMDINRYLIQVKNTAEELMKLFPSFADRILANEEAYCDKVSAVLEDIPHGSFEGENIVIFHEAFEYLAESLGMNVVHSVEVDADTSLSAGELAEVLEEIREEHVHFVFTEAQYGTQIANAVAAESDVKVVVIDSLVTGDGSKDSYIEGMKSNIEILRGLR